MTSIRTPLTKQALLTAVAFILLSGCVGYDSSAPDSGIMGVVYIGPTCPVQQQPPDPQCDDRRFETPLVALEGERVVARFSSDVNGEYKVALEPGTYSIARPPGSSSPPSCHTQPISVIAHDYSVLDVRCDSGIR